MLSTPISSVVHEDERNPVEVLHSISVIGLERFNGQVNGFLVHREISLDTWRQRFLVSLR